MSNGRSAIITAASTVNKCTLRETLRASRVGMTLASDVSERDPGYASMQSPNVRLAGASLVARSIGSDVSVDDGAKRTGMVS